MSYIGVPTNKPETENKDVQQQQQQQQPRLQQQQNDNDGSKAATNEDPNAPGEVKKEGALLQLAAAGQTPKKLPTLNSPPRSRLAPVNKPVGINPIDILKERESRYIIVADVCNSILMIIYVIIYVYLFLTSEFKQEWYIESKHCKTFLRLSARSCAREH